MPRPLLCLFMTAALLPAAQAADKTLYKCRAADGSLAFQEQPCASEPLQVIPIQPDQPPRPVQLKNDTCRALARLVWRQGGEVGQTEFGNEAQQALLERRKTLRAQCGVELNPSPLAMDCATLQAALRLDVANPDQKTPDARARIESQHRTQCADDAIERDIQQSLRAVEIGLAPNP